ncbi:MAG: diphthine synthase [Nanoarchaeota archaeon]|nr:diphthine synthase [Nanoarchaeota archaeon]
MLYLIGTGISGWDNIALKGLDYAKKCDTVFIERYTSIISDEDVAKLNNLVGKGIIELSRKDLETNFEEKILKKAGVSDVALLIVGDPLTATTHIEFLKSCKDNNIRFEVVHASSIYSSICETGLHVYKFGKSCSIPYPEPNYKPTSYFDIIKKNHENNAHTLVFLDIKKNEDKYMTISEALKILLNISRERNSFLNKSTRIIGVSRLGFKDQVIKYGTVKELLNYKFSKQPHILVVPSMSEIEKDYVEALYA